MDIERSLIDQYREIFESGDGFQGLSVIPHVNTIGKLISGVKAKTVLDYGCGRALAYTGTGEKGRVWKRWGVEKPTLYDPAYPPYSRRPRGKFDVVICCDVLEHIPEPELPAFLADVFGFAERAVFFTVCCRPAKRILPNGQNAHVTLMPVSWWTKRIRKASGGKRFRLVESE